MLLSNAEIRKICTAWAILRAVLGIFARMIAFAPSEFPPDGNRLILSDNPAGCLGWVGQGGGSPELFLYA
jgi:hypothetical protein